MDINLATVADYALVDQAGKMSVLGIFDVLGAAKFPVVHPKMFLCLRIEFRSVEVGTRHRLNVQLQGADGEKVSPPIAAEFQVSSPPYQGGPINQQLAIGFEGITFTQPGPYSFEIMIDEQHRRSVPIHVAQVNMSPST